MLAGNGMISTHASYRLFQDAIEPERIFHSLIESPPKSPLLLTTRFQLCSACKVMITLDWHLECDYNDKGNVRCDLTAILSI